eukprot:210252_1
MINLQTTFLSIILLAILIQNNAIVNENESQKTLDFNDNIEENGVIKLTIDPNIMWIVYIVFALFGFCISLFCIGISVYIYNSFCKSSDVSFKIDDDDLSSNVSI